jgi:hypothetical protein
MSIPHEHDREDLTGSRLSNSGRVASCVHVPLSVRHARGRAAPISAVYRASAQCRDGDDCREDVSQKAVHILTHLN